MIVNPAEHEYEHLLVNLNYDITYVHYVIFCFSYLNCLCIHFDILKKINLPEICICHIYISGFSAVKPLIIGYYNIPIALKMG